MTGLEATQLLKPFVQFQFGDEVWDAPQRLKDFRALAPGSLPSDYTETLLWLKRATLLVDNQIMSVEPPRPREEGMFEHVGPNPPFERMYGLQASHTNVFEAFDDLRWRLPPQLIPIGDDGSGNAICLDLSEAGHGRVFHWFHVGDPGPNDEQGRPGWGNTFLLAHSFTDLCRRLRPAPPRAKDGPVGKICFFRP